MNDNSDPGDSYPFQYPPIFLSEPQNIHPFFLFFLVTILLQFVNYNLKP
jgi:hypothetical protein